MTKIFTIGFSGKSPDAFQDVLNAARISCVWDICQGQNFQGGRSQSCRARQILYVRTSILRGSNNYKIARRRLDRRSNNLITPERGFIYFLCGGWDYE